MFAHHQIPAAFHQFHGLNTFKSSTGLGKLMTKIVENVGWPSSHIQPSHAISISSRRFSRHAVPSAQGCGRRCGRGFWPGNAQYQLGQWPYGGIGLGPWKLHELAWTWLDSWEHRKRSVERGSESGSVTGLEQVFFRHDMNPDMNDCQIERSQDIHISASPVQG